MKSIEKSIEAAVRFIQKKTTQNELGLSLSRYHWVEEDRWDPQESEFDDIGDYVLFVAWYGMLKGKPEAVNWVEKQVERWTRHFQQKNGLFVSLWRVGEKIPKKSLVRPFSFYDHQDAIVGLQSLAQLTGNGEYQKRANAIAEQAFYFINRYNGFLPNRVWGKPRITMPLTCASSTVNAIFAEEFVLNYKQEGDERYLKAAEKILTAWTETPLFQSDHLFAPGYHPWFQRWSPYKKTFLMKENTNMVYALTEYLKIKDPLKSNSDLKKALENNLTAWERFRHESGGYFHVFDMVKHEVVKDKIDKTHNFALIEGWVDAHKVFKKSEWLERAIKVADFWIEGMNPDTHLIPDYFYPNKGWGNYAKLDQTADLGVAFLKLAEVTEDKKYQKAAEQLSEGLGHFLTREGNWRRLVSVETGKQPSENEIELQDRPGGRNLTKYIGGALKFLLTLSEIRKGNRFDSNPLFQLLTRDR